MANSSVRRSLMLSLMQKRFLYTTSSTVTPSSPLPTVSSSSSFTVQYLVNTCGLPLQSALSASRKLQLHQNNLQKPQSVLDLLKSHDFNNTHVAKLIEKWPQILQCRVENNLKPKLDFYVKSGFVGQLLPELVVSNPGILQMALDSHIKPCFEFLKTFLHSDETIVAAVKRGSWFLKTNLKSVMQPNINFLIKEGVPVDMVAKLLIMEARTITLKPDRMVYAVNAVKNLGLEPKSSTFIRAVRVILSMSESTWKKKMELMKSFGWSEEEILWAFKRDPYCLACSEAKMRHAMDFYVNTMKLGPQTIISYPKFLMHAIDKTMRPRYNVLKVLKSKKLIDGNKRIEWLLTLSEKKFFENYVKKYVDKVPGLLEIYGTNKAKELDA